jgi:hypothetical protein
MKAMGSAGMLANLKLLLIGVAVAFITAAIIELYNLLFTDKHTVFHTMYEDLQNIMNYWKSEVEGTSFWKWLTGGIEGTKKDINKLIPKSFTEEDEKDIEMRRNVLKSQYDENPITKLVRGWQNMDFGKLLLGSPQDIRSMRENIDRPNASTTFGAPVIKNDIKVYVDDVFTSDTRIIESVTE